MRGLAVLVVLVGAGARAESPVSAVAYSGDATLAAGLLGEVRLFDAESKPAGVLAGQDGRVSSLAYAPSGALAAASGSPGASGVVRLYAPGSQSPRDTFTAHKDSVLALAWSPDGATLATASYDRTVKLWAVTSAPAKLLHTLTDHSDSVYAVAFHSGGKLIATGAADRAVKVWDSATGKRLYTLSDPTDWVYSVAWRNDLLYAGGVDRSVRVWRATPTGGKLLAAAVAHAGPVVGVYPDGESVLTLSEDGRAKSWGGLKLEARGTSATMPFPLAGAVGPKSRLAVARFDGTLEVLDAAALKPGAKLLPAPPTLATVAPGNVLRERSTVVTLTGTGLDRLTGVKASRDGVVATLLPPKSPRERQVAIATTSAGPVRLVGVVGIDEIPGPVVHVDWFPAATVAAGGLVTLPASVGGAIARTGGVDRFPVGLASGEQLGVELAPASGAGAFEPVLAMCDADGRVVAEAVGTRLGYTASRPGRYAVTVRDRQYRGSAKYAYRLHLGPVPVVAGLVPLTVPAGVPSEVRLVGVNLGASAVVTVTPPADARPGDAVALPLPGAFGARSVRVGDFPAVPVVAGRASLSTVPMAAHGVLAEPNAQHRVSFRAKKGERLAIEVMAARLGSPVDSTLTILDAGGKPVPRVVLRAVSRVFTIFRDNPARATNIRLESWNELATDDYLYSEGQLMRVAELPGHPDADALFYGVAGRRETFLGTTAHDIANGTPLYKVEFHPPGATLVPNGLPVAELPYRNDDALGADSLILFDPPADGDYTAVVADSRSSSGPAHAYTLVVRKPKPRFTLSFSPAAPKVFAGAGVPVTVTATRLDGFDGPIRVGFEQLPKGFAIPDAILEAGQTTAVVPLSAGPGAKSGSIRAVGRAEVDGVPVSVSAEFGPASTRARADFALTTDRQVVSIKPGGRAKLTITVARQPNFKARVPCQVLGLPHGVMVLDLGLNGVLIRPDETRREVVISAEPWVKPTRAAFVVTSKAEGKTPQVAAPAIELAVE